MKLPEDNSIELSQDNGLVVDRSDSVLPTIEDGVNLFPEYIREIDSAVRDAMVAAWRAMANELWSRFGRVLSQVTSARFAAAQWLDDIGDVLHKRRASGEEDHEYRKRLLDISDVVSPNAIKEGVNAIVQESLLRDAVFMEPATDAIFFQTAQAEPPWCAFYQTATQRLWGTYIENRNPYVGAYFSGRPNVPEFWVILPGNADDDSDSPYFMPSGAVQTPDFFSPATFPAGWLQADERYYPERPDSLMERVNSELEQKRAGGVRTMIFQDPNLLTAK